MKIHIEKPVCTNREFIKKRDGITECFRIRLNDIFRPTNVVTVVIDNSLNFYLRSIVVFTRITKLKVKGLKSNFYKNVYKIVQINFIFLIRPVFIVVL